MKLFNILLNVSEMRTKSLYCHIKIKTPLLYVCFQPGVELCVNTTNGDYVISIIFLLF